ncbi:hypothetical protein PRIPAC_76106 [Pristionchus pacificus]|uniref:Uncharacterized protein n=1 Tax=Pristionchus pacificus TaxID=54126 RepID=A0A454XWC0_PRIPA|nr:hypothetical protein PRIPAC_76106 [Pristionchus pacificus]|eukprot:PDM80926.1 hypothetical protein PRIPAC_35929 [Pristionchus pacificus]
MGKTVIADCDRWAVPRSRSTFDLNEDGDEKKKGSLGRWFSTMKLNEEEDKEQLVDKENKTRARSNSRRRSSIKDDIVNFFNRRRGSVPVIQLRPPVKEEKPKPIPVQMPVQIEDDLDSDDFSLSSSPPLAPFMIVDRSLLPPPPVSSTRRFSLGNLLKKH